MNVLYEKTCEGGLDDIAARLETAVDDHGFTILNDIDLGGKMRSKGLDFDADCRIYEVCNAKRAKEVLDQDLSISTALPCRISLYRSRDGNPVLSTLLPTALIGLFGKEQLAPVAESVETDIKAIMDQAAG